MMLLGGAKGSVRVWDVPTCTAVALLESGREAVSCVALSPNHDLLITAGPPDGTVRMWR